MGDVRGSPLTVRLLGGFAIERGGSPIDTLPTAHARSVIGFLALNPGRPLTRDLVAGSCWPDSSEAESRHLLRQALWSAKSSLGVDIFVRGTGVLQLDRTLVDLDVDRFRSSIERAATCSDPEARIRDLEEAVSVYRGDLLDGYYEEWVGAEREPLRRQFRGALERLVELHSAERREESALVHARRLAIEDPWNESAHRRVMWLSAATGRLHDALRQYEICRSILDEEFEVGPAIETVDLYESILTERESGAPRAFSSEGPLIGRDRERTEAAAILDGTSAGRGGVVLIEGDSGVGKTRLLEALAADAAWRGIPSWHLRGVPEQEPYGAVLPALRELSPPDLLDSLDAAGHERIERLLDPGSGTAPDYDDHTAMHGDVAAALVGEGRPRLITIDDVHDLDPASSAVLARLGAKSADTPVVVVAAYRHDTARARPEIWESVSALDRTPGGLRLALGPLSAGQTEALVRSAVGYEIDPSVTAALHRATGGLPYLVIEALRDPELASGSDAVALAVRNLANDLIVRRTQDLPTEATDTLHLIALLGRPASPALLSALEAKGAKDLLSRGLVERRDEDVGVGSDMIRDAVTRRIDADELPGLHVRLADALEQAHPESVDAIATHLLHAGDDERAAPFLESAARRDMALHEYEPALARLRQADEAMARAGATESRLGVLRSILEVLDMLGHRTEVGPVLDVFEAIATGSDALDAIRLRARACAQEDDFDRARRLARKALDAAADARDAEREVAALAELAMVECLAGNAQAGVELLDEASGFGSVGVRAQAAARNALGQNLVDLQRFEEAEVQLLAAQALYRDLGDSRGEVDAIGMLAVIRMERGDVESAADRYEQALTLSRRIGYREGEARNLCNLGIAMALRAAIAASLDLFEQGSSQLLALGRQSGYLTVQLNAAWLRHRLLGDDASAERVAQQSLRTAIATADVRAQSQARALLGSVLARRGNWDRASAEFETSVDLGRTAGDVWLESQHLSHFARAAMEYDKHELAAELIESGRNVASSHGLADLATALSLDEADRQIRRGEPEKALEILTAIPSSPSVEPFRHPWLVSRALEAVGQHDKADRHLETAWRTYQEMLEPFSQDATDQAVAAVPDLARMSERWNKRRPRRIELQAVRATVGPRDRVTPDDIVTVQVSIDRPGDDTIENKTERRRHRIMRILTEVDAAGALLTVEDLTRLFQISDKTARRDLGIIRNGGHPARTRGNLDRN